MENNRQLLLFLYPPQVNGAKVAKGEVRAVSDCQGVAAEAAKDNGAPNPGFFE
jgi:hypothetical protein